MDITNSVSVRCFGAGMSGSTVAEEQELYQDTGGGCGLREQQEERTERKCSLATREGM